MTNIKVSELEFLISGVENFSSLVIHDHQVVKTIDPLVFTRIHSTNYSCSLITLLSAYFFFTCCKNTE